MNNNENDWTPPPAPVDKILEGKISHVDRPPPPFVGDDDHGPDPLPMIQRYFDRGGCTRAQSVLAECAREISLLRDILHDRTLQLQRVRERDAIAEEILSSEEFTWLMVGANHPQIHLNALKPAYAAWRERGGRSVFSPEWKPSTPPQNPSTPTD
jgi:hypothetical protein